MITKMLVLAIQVFVLTFAFRYTGFSSDQTILLTLSIVAAIHTRE